MWRPVWKAGAFLISCRVRFTQTVRWAGSIRSTVPAGISTSWPKIHGPVSTTRCEGSTSAVCRSTLPIRPSSACTR